jgi:two-component system osmolarity sensor histidine kinase EnvZ
MPRGLSLTHQNAWRLALVFVVFELLVALAVVFLLMLPMARRASSDLAGLMVLSAQTWSELPPQTRAAFTRELAASHQIELSVAAPSGTPANAWLSLYLRRLEQSLTARTGRAVDLRNVIQEGETWHWAALPSGGRVLWVGFPHGRIGPQPLMTALLTLAAGMVLALLAAWWLARRTVAPLKRFDAAAASLGRGETPELLPETGPRELAALAHRFNELARQVRDLLEARTTLLAGLSHDLRTPLARMRLALEMQQRKPDPAWIARLDTDIEEMNRLVGDLLELARGLGSEVAEPVDVPALLEALARRERELGAGTDAEVRVHSPPLHLDAPPATLSRILENLLANARRYAPGAPVELRAEETAGICRIGVLDRGPGIPEAQLETVFRPFHRVESSRNTATGGTGLGLAIVRQLAQANGWRVHLQNRAGGGLAAWLEIPTQAGAV